MTSASNVRPINGSVQNRATVVAPDTDDSRGDYPIGPAAHDGLHDANDGMMGWWGVDGVAPGAGVSIVGGLGVLLFCLVILFGIGYVLYRLFTRLWPSVENPALEELRLAYARGELSQEEFEQRRNDLQQ